MPVPPCAPQLPHGLWNCVSSRARCGFRQGQILSIHLSRSRSVRSGREWLSLQRHGCCRSLRPSAVCRALLRSGQSHSAQQVFRHRQNYRGEPTSVDSAVGRDCLAVNVMDNLLFDNYIGIHERFRPAVAVVYRITEHTQYAAYYRFAAAYAAGYSCECKVSCAQRGAVR